MKGVENIGESLDLSIIIAIVMAGINALWGIFLLPWGVVGFVFAAVNVLLAILLRKVEDAYSGESYKKARDFLYFPMLLGFIFGWIILGIYLYLIYKALDDIVIRSHLVKEVPEISPMYGSPKIPERKR
ncbi:hypothetical protein B6U71_02455 [Euryarchaeota archaeon ex4484_178]|nr:MAG: hypothetical protein B6U71_02455 [Euryarchaeota archaeon ex4484_178]